MKNIALIGFQSSGKTVVGKGLAEKTGKLFVDLDDVIKEINRKEKGDSFSCREIYKNYGADYFRSIETKAIKQVVSDKGIVLSLGGGAIMHEANARLLKKRFIIVYLKDSAENLLKRMEERGIPAFLDPSDLGGSMKRELAKREPIYEKNADIKIDRTNLEVEQIVRDIVMELAKKTH